VLSGAASERQLEFHQGVEKIMLGELDLAPRHDVAVDRRVGNHAVMPAGQAKLIGAGGVDHPIADAELGIGTEAIELALGRARAPSIALGLERGYYLGAGNVA